MSNLKNHTQSAESRGSVDMTEPPHDCAECGVPCDGHVCFDVGGQERVVCEACMAAHYDSSGYPHANRG